MPKRITIEPHLSLDELESLYRGACDPIERSHYQIIWLLAQGRSSSEVAAVTGYSRSWIYELVWGYNRIGPETLGDGRHQNPGAKPLLDDVQQANLLQALRGPAPDGGLWNGRKVAAYLSALIGEPVSRQQGWEYLKQMRLRLRVPRPSHQEADADEQEAWKKKLVQEVERIQASHPDADVEVNNVSLKMRAALFRVVCWWLELSVSKAALIFNDFSLVWCEDEHRIGLGPLMRRLWVEEGEQPIAQVNWKRQWLWLYGFVQPQTGQTKGVDSALCQHQVV